MARRNLVGRQEMSAALWRAALLIATFCSYLALADSAFAQGAEPAVTAPPPAEAAPVVAAPSVEPPSQRSLLTAIEVDAGATCLAADKLIRRVERWLNQNKVDARIRVQVRGDESDATKVQFVIDRGDGQPPAVRRIEDAPADCDQLHSALALSIALAIDASILGGGPIELPDDDALLAEEEPPAEEEASYMRVALGVMGQLSTGLLTSDLAVGAAGRLELGVAPWLDLRLGAMFASIGDQRVEAIPGTFDATIVGGRADVCGAYSPAQVLRLLACGSGVVGQFRTVGYGYTRGETVASLWSAAGFGLEAQARALDRLAFAVSVDLLIPFARRTVLVRDPAGVTVAERQLTAVGIVIGAGAVFRVF